MKPITWSSTAPAAGNAEGLAALSWSNWPRARSLARRRGMAGRTMADWPRPRRPAPRVCTTFQTLAIAVRHRPGRSHASQRSRVPTRAPRYFRTPAARHRSPSRCSDRRPISQSWLRFLESEIRESSGLATAPARWLPQPRPAPPSVRDNGGARDHGLRYLVDFDERHARVSAGSGQFPRSTGPAAA